MGIRGATGPPLEYASGGRGPLLETQHADRRTRSCGGFSAVGVEGGGCRVYPVRCKRWKCARCNANKVREARDRLSAGYVPGSTWFVTLTMPASVDPDTSFDLISGAFKRLRQRMERAHGRREWASVVEAQGGRGAAHLHILVRGPLMSPAWLLEAAVASGFGPIVDVRPARTDHARYMVKSLHLRATVGMRAYARRVSSSKGWAARRPRLGVHRSVQWWISNAPPEDTASFLRALGYVVTDVVRGPPSRRPPWLPVRWWPAGSRSALTPSLPYPEAA